MTIKSIAFTGYPVSDMTRARKFYEDVLGLKPAKDFGGHWQEYDLGEGTFALILLGETSPACYKDAKGASIAFEVDDIAATEANFREQNIPIIEGPHEFPGCHMLVINDTEGNVVSFHQLKKA